MGAVNVWSFFKKKKPSYNLRYAQDKDIPFILHEVGDGLNKGYFAFDHTNGLGEFSAQLQRITAAHANSEKIGNVLFVFEEAKATTPLAFALLAAGQADHKLPQHLILVMFGVSSSSRGKGLGSLFLQYLMAHMAGMPVLASCLPASKVMADMLQRHNFSQISVSPRGKRTFVHS